MQQVIYPFTNGLAPDAEYELVKSVYNTLMMDNVLLCTELHKFWHSLFT